MNGDFIIFLIEQIVRTTIVFRCYERCDSDDSPCFLSYAPFAGPSYPPSLFLRSRSSASCFGLLRLTTCDVLSSYRRRCRLRRRFRASSVFSSILIPPSTRIRPRSHLQSINVRYVIGSLVAFLSSDVSTRLNYIHLHCPRCFLVPRHPDDFPTRLRSLLYLRRRYVAHVRCL